MVSLILGVLALFFVQSMLPACFRYALDKADGVAWRTILGPRDEQPPMPALGGRAARALNNLQEALPIFITLALLHLIRKTEAGLAEQGAAIFLGARVLYVPAYLSGIGGIRTLVWTVGLVGLGCMVAALF
jgi:uncharacterized MAPEG superfamily protein